VNLQRRDIRKLLATNKVLVVPIIDTEHVTVASQVTLLEPRKSVIIFELR
jgi:hypothetical protein